MAVKTEIKETQIEDKGTLQNAIASLKKSMADYKKERKSEWKAFKSKFNDDMDSIEKSLKKTKIFFKK